MKSSGGNSTFQGGLPKAFPCFYPKGVLGFGGWKMGFRPTGVGFYVAKKSFCVGGGASGYACKHFNSDPTFKLFG
jgi:hypothetical protein